MNIIIICFDLGNKVYDGVLISNVENKFLKIYEVEILGNIFLFLINEKIFEFIKLMKSL